MPKPHTVGLIGILVACASGCSLWSDKSDAQTKSWSPSKFWKKEYQQPQSLAIIWSPDELMVTGQPPTRGFGGRVFFYNQVTQAVPVDGELIVHGYHSQPILGESQQVQADKTFAFTAEQLTKHFSPSQLGASYSIWIPWDIADGFREEVTLIATFKGKDGSIVQGSPSKLYLPGKALITGKEDQPQVSASTVAFQKSSNPAKPGEALPEFDRSQPTTIQVPRSSSFRRVGSDAVEPDSNRSQFPNSGYQVPQAVEIKPTSNISQQRDARPQVGAGFLLQSPAGASELKPNTTSPRTWLSPPSLQLTLGSAQEGNAQPVATQPVATLPVVAPKIQHLAPPISNPSWSARSAVQPASYRP